MNFFKKAVMSLCILGLVVSFAGASFADTTTTLTKNQVKPQAVDLNGIWNCNDGGKYYIRQIGDAIWWSGMSNGGSGTNFSNVFHGKLNGDVVSGSWADVPRGYARSYGTIYLKVIFTGTGIKLNKTYSSGGFGGTKWWQ